MSVEAILVELPKLDLAELGLIRERTEMLLLQFVLDEADAAFEKEGGVSLSEARRVVDSWIAQ